MAKGLLIEASLHWQNSIGKNQLISEMISGKSVITHILNNLSLSTHIDFLYVITTNYPIDDQIFNEVNKFSNNKSFPIKCIRFNFKEIIIEPALRVDFPNFNLEEVLNLNKIFNPLSFPDFLLKLKDMYLLDTVYTTNFENITLMNETILDDIIRTFDNQFIFIIYNSFVVFSFLPLDEVKSAYSEIRSEMLQNKNIKISMLRKENASNEQMDIFLENYRFPITINKLISKANPSINWKNHTLKNAYLSLNPFFILHNNEDLKFLQNIAPLIDEIKNLSDIESFRKENAIINILEIANQIEIIEKKWNERKSNITWEHLIISFSKINLKSSNILSKCRNLTEKKSIIKGITFDFNDNPIDDALLSEILDIFKEEDLKFISVLSEDYKISIDKIKLLYEKGLNSFILNLENLKLDENVKAFIDSVINFKQSLPEKTSFKFYLRINFSLPKYDLIKELFKKYSLLVTKILVLPPKFDEKEQTVNLNPEFKNLKDCLWMRNTLSINENFDLILCDQYKNDTMGDISKFENVSLLRGKSKPCETCNFKYRNNGFNKTLINDFFLRQEKSLISQFDYLSIIENDLFNSLANKINCRIAYTMLIQLSKHINEKIIFYKLINAHKEEYFKVIENLFKENAFEEILNLIEYILQFDPVCEKAFEILDTMEKKIG